MKILAAALLLAGADANAVASDGATPVSCALLGLRDAGGAEVSRVLTGTIHRVPGAP